LRSGLSSSSSISSSTTARFVLFLLGISLVSSCLSNGLSILLVLVDGPIKDVVVLEGFTHEKVTEDLAEVGIVRLVIEAEGASVVQVDSKFIGEATAKDLSGSCHLLFHDTVVFLLLGSGFESLPRKRSTTEVEHYVAQRLHVITTRLLHSQMSVDTGVASGTSQVLVLTVWNMEMSLGVTVFLRKTEVDNVDLVTTLPNAHQEVVRFDVTVDEGLGMDVLDARDQLIREEKDSLQGEFAVAEVEEILQTGSKEIKNHGVVITLGAEPANEGDTDTSSERLVDTSLIFELGMLGLDTLKFDGNFLTGDDVGSYLISVMCEK
jgi:hypothetical protein